MLAVNIYLNTGRASEIKPNLPAVFSRFHHQALLFLWQYWDVDFILLEKLSMSIEM